MINDGTIVSILPNNKTRPDRGRPRSNRLCPKGSQYLFLGILLGIYIDRTFKLIATLDGRSASESWQQQSSIHDPITSSILSSSLPKSSSSSSSSSSSILSKRLITVFGTESSGSTFLATTLGIASGAFPSNGTYVTLKSDRHNNPGRTIVERVVARSARSEDGSIEVQHLSLPWGFWGSKKRNCDLSASTITVDAFVPEPCFRFDYESTWPHRLAEKAPAGCRDEAHISQTNNNHNNNHNVVNSSSESSGNGDIRWTCGSNTCGQNENDGYAIYPRRFYVNISSHLEWYLARGVDVTAVLSVRDRSTSRAGKMRAHCKDESISVKEEERARAILSESLRRYGRLGRWGESGAMIPHNKKNVKEDRVVVVSYEALMALQESYLFDIYKMLGINSTYVPEFKDGNEKYFKNK
eukprot:CAMPEP_0183757886 /NCGR_PEP_ID=MMETSP0739-20130205/6039_1 /TAXON_ID=385413 /ORGANISM="Thalassiosira miniscula, Strain CCMP1093" /LENGTH=410 /DNA_ID=CAMNT_0025995395 /DNA_START=101 /DNA_END=1333 /DNA_ORIENTATION=+